jgi:DNA modification methylase
MTMFTIETGDVLSHLRAMPSNTFSACLSDPPYGLSFMGKKWDYDVPKPEVWAEVLRVLKPGAPLLSFGGTRTYHRLVCAIEDGGFEIRDQLDWLYGTGFPKSLDIAKAIDKSAGHWRGRAGAIASDNGAMSGGNYERTPKGDPITAAAAAWEGYGTALKPGHEPICLAMKPLDGTYAQNAAKWGVGGLAIDACRIGDEVGGWGGGAAGGSTWNAENCGLAKGGDARPVVGRWPANVLLDEEAAGMLDAQSGTSRSGVETKPRGGGGIWSPSDGNPCGPQYGDSGGASRFFYVAKPSRSERDKGLEDFTTRNLGGTMVHADGNGTERIDGKPLARGKNHHPTVKPTALTCELAKLILPPRPGALLVPYSGVGSEMIGALLAGWGGVVGIEQDTEYVKIAVARILAHVKGAERIAA